MINNIGSIEDEEIEFCKLKMQVIYTFCASNTVEKFVNFHQYCEFYVHIYTYKTLKNLRESWSFLPMFKKRLKWRNLKLEVYSTLQQQYNFRTVLLHKNKAQRNSVNYFHFKGTILMLN